MLNKTDDADRQDQAGDSFDPYALLGHLPMGVIVCELDFDRGCPLPVVNDSARALLRMDGVTDSPFRLEDAPALEFGEPLLGEFKRACRSGRRIDYEWLVELGGREQCLGCSIVPLGRRGVTDQVLCTLVDRTAEKRAENNLLQHALHDGLTGLPNRSLFLNRLEEAVARSRAEDGAPCAVLVINVDRFQLINESFGHSAGDALLVELTDSLRGCLRAGDLLARFNGDEFAVLAQGLSSTEDLESLAARIHEVMSEPRMIAETKVFLSVSIGVASTETSHSYPEDLIRDADVAMHRAKTIGRARTEIFERESHTPKHDQIQLETALRRALEIGELELYYQPVLDLETGRIVAMEALTRWHHPDRGFISPADFIPLAEDTGLIVPLGRWAIDQACRQLAEWRRSVANDTDLSVNVNLSAIQFLQDDVASVVGDTLRTTGIPGEALRLEITESALVADPEGAAQTLRAIKAHGATLALDDFGTGYSSLNYLSNFPIDCIKIDRSFVSHVERDEPSSKIVRIITMLADTLRMSVVAEGIESPDQLQVMRSLGCRYGQGFLFSRPLPAQEAAEFLKDNAVPHAPRDYTPVRT